ncbi:MAG: YHYH protein [Rhodospirillales bacterium]|nr:YHYH protein [Rhodospirillales bacterium]
MIFSFVVLSAAPAWAHGGSHDHSYARPIPAAVEQARVNIIEQGHYRLMSSNGIPNHETGQFPNRGNPNAIRAQDYQYRMKLRPVKTGRSDLARGFVFGVALNGIPFDPGTAEFYNNDPRSGWNIEAITGGINLGLDNSNAHVQPDGSYHYHGIPWGIVSYFDHEHGDMMMAGYAADGFPVYMPVDGGKGFHSSYRVKSGTRPSGPGGAYDGTYTADWEYVSGLGDLDECNGMDTPKGYVYILTEQFPFIPRCFMGTPDDSFKKAPPSGPRGQRPPPGMRPGHRPPGPF